MAIPDIASYLASTRQPLDLAGPAIQAFQAVSSEMRASRAQNLAEEESARDLGKGIKEGMQKDRMFEEDIIDKRQLRGIRAEDQDFERQRLGFEAMRLGMDMEKQRFTMQNLMPLEIQQKQLSIAMDAQKYQAQEEELRMHQHMLNLGTANLGQFDSLVGGKADVPEVALAPGEDAASNKPRIRAAYHMLNQLETGIGSVSKNPALKMQLAMRRQMLEADPDFQEMMQNDELMLPRDRDNRSNQRNTILRSMLPGDDNWKNNFIDANKGTIAGVQNLPDAQWEMVTKQLWSQAGNQFKEERSVFPGQSPSLGQGAINSLASAAAEVEAAKAELNAATSGGRSSAFRTDPLRAKVASAEARYNALTKAYGGMVPGANLPSDGPPTAPGGTSIDMFYEE